jgi:hypothetical protein
VTGNNQAVHPLEQQDAAARIQCCHWFRHSGCEGVHMKYLGLSFKWNTCTSWQIYGYTFRLIYLLTTCQNPQVSDVESLSLFLKALFLTQDLNTSYYIIIFAIMASKTAVY